MNNVTILAQAVGPTIFVVDVFSGKPGREKIERYIRGYLKKEYGSRVDLQSLMFKWSAGSEEEGGVKIEVLDVKQGSVYEEPTARFRLEYRSVVEI